MAVLIETTLGDLVIDLFVKERPNCSKNFLKLCKTKYYNLCQFHTIEQNYMAQTGDPTGTGRGGESVFASIYGEQARFFEKEDLPKMKHTRVGIVSFVNNGNDQLGSQFFITLGENIDHFDQHHTIFGQVTEGLDTLEKLNDELCDDDNRPFRDIRIAHTIVLDDPFSDFPNLRYPERSPSPTYEQLVQVNKIALDEKVDEDEGKSAEEIAKEMQQREMEEQAQILEMVGDLRSADDAPPDNVLFVCKLNPVTQDDDLETIFSRFGKITSCEIIRDRRTKQSLQYAFVEFEDPKACERAFFKMDNVLIDDRRIHVDFSQSVAKNYKWERGGKGKAEVKEEPRSPVHVKREIHSRSPERKRNRSPRRNDHRNRSNSHERRKSGHRGRRSPERRRDDRRRDNYERRSRDRNNYRKRSPSPKRRRSRSPKRSSRR